MIIRTLVETKDFRKFSRFIHSNSGALLKNQRETASSFFICLNLNSNFSFEFQLRSRLLMQISYICVYRLQMSFWNIRHLLIQNEYFIVRLDNGSCFIILSKFLFFFSNVLFYGKFVEFSFKRLKENEGRPCSSLILKFFIG